MIGCTAARLDDLLRRWPAQIPVIHLDDGGHAADEAAVGLLKERYGFRDATGKSALGRQHTR